MLILKVVISTLKVVARKEMTTFLAPWRFTEKVFAGFKVLVSAPEFRAIIRDGNNYVSDSSQATLKKETSMVKPHALEEDTGQERAPKHVASPSLSHFSGSSEGHPERNFERGQGWKSRIGWPSNDAKFETF